MTENDPQGHALAIFGAGVMGAGISTLALAHGVPVTLVDVTPEILERARGRVEHELRLASLMGAVADVPAGLLTTSTSVEAAAGASVVIEAVTESAGPKEKVLTAITDVVGPQVPVITNTSSIPIDEPADALADPAQLTDALESAPT
jgi:methoxymalonate biosynthesis protein